MAVAMEASPDAGADDSGGKRHPSGIDLDAWRGDLQRLHGTLDQVVQSFITSQTRQLDTVAAELASQKERIVNKERHFVELSDSIASFVEEETKRLEAWGVPMGDAEADSRHEAYDAELPGPPALHRINRLWRKATRAFDAMKEVKEQEASRALEEQREKFEGLVAEAEQRCEALKGEREAEVKALESRIEAVQGEGEQKEGMASALSQEVQTLGDQLSKTKTELAEMAKRLEQVETTKSRLEYEWGAEREELTREHGVANARGTELEGALAEAHEREEELRKSCADRADKLEQMKRLMDDQEREMTTKIDRVQQYVKERQAGALHAEKKQQDAERMAERWQGEVRRLQGEKDKLAKLVLDLENRQLGQANEIRGAWEKHQSQVSALEDALHRKDEEMRAANVELLRQRDDEYQAKVSLEKQREKDRSVALLKKKEQEVQIKDQQLKAARQRIQELECGAKGPAKSTSPSSRGSGPSAGRRQQLMGDGSLPPLPLSAR